jgi:hypothetical protein
MKLLEHPAITAFGVATILLLSQLMMLASPTHTLFYHLSGPVSAVAAPVLLIFSCIWLLLTLLLRLGSRFIWLDVCLWSTLGVALPWRLVQTWFYIYSLHQISHLANLAAASLFLSAPVATLAVRSRAITLFRFAKRVAVTLLSFIALSGLLLFAEALGFAWQARDLNAPQALHQPEAGEMTRAHRGRIVWVVFDELSHRQVYEHRYAGLELPAFDRLATEATVFTHTVPAGNETAIVLPSFITGLPLDKIRTSARGWHLEMHNTSIQAWQQLDPHDTVFQDALNAGYSTAVVGWYNPYCRILPQVLDRCFWTYHGLLPGGIFPGQSIAWNTEQPMLHYLRAFGALVHRSRHYDDSSTGTAFHQQDYNELYAAGDRLLDDPSVNFVLLHMPIPHPGGIYNRHTHSFVTTRPSYVDNLALCDIYLAHVRQKLEQDGTWDKTTLVLMGDHSWRVPLLWANSPVWTQEEQIASDGAQFDDRPAYVVKLPHQTSPGRIETPFAALRTRELFDNLLSGRITTPRQLDDWAQQAKSLAAVGVGTANPRGGQTP